MIANIQLAKAANFTAAGELNILGGGWDTIGPSPLPSHTVLASVSNIEGEPKGLDFSLKLVDSKDSLVVVGVNEPLNFYGTLDISDPTERPPGIPGAANIAIEIGAGINLDPGLYKWVFTVGREPSVTQTRLFYVRAKVGEFPITSRVRETPINRAY